MTYRLKLHIQGVDVIRGDQPLIENLTFSLEAGQSLLLTGSNGSGKTSLLKSLAGFLPLRAGSCVVTNGDDPLVQSTKGLIHYVGHKDGLRNSLTVEGNLRFWADYYRDEEAVAGCLATGDESDALGTQAHFDAVLKRFDLQDLLSLPVAYLSAGQKRRVSLARLKLVPKPIWLLDEPTVSLDKDNVAFFATLMKEHLAQGGLIIAATHIDFGMDFTFHLTLGQSQHEVAA